MFSVQPDSASKSFSFVESHFSQVAFAVSTLVLLILQPLSLLMGTLTGFFLHYTFEPTPYLKEGERAITTGHIAMAMIGALAALVRLTPAGISGNYLFQSLPYLFSIGIGSAAYVSWYGSSSQ